MNRKFFVFLNRILLFRKDEGRNLSVAVTRTFSGGIHPSEIGNGKAATKEQSIINVPAPAKVTIPMSMHGGAPASICVKVGQTVNLGQLIGEPQGYISASVHASVSGRVCALTQSVIPSGKSVPAVVIENDFEDRWDESITSLQHKGDVTQEEIIECARSLGVVGLGGATFPTAVKLDTSKLDPKPDTLIINGSECEPYLTSDHRLMVEEADRIADGVSLAMKASGCKKAIIGIEDNKPDAVSALQQASNGRYEVVALPAKYPQGFEKMLIYSLTGRKVPNGGLPSAVQCVVLNVGTCEALSRAVRDGHPIVDRVVTVAGKVKNPGNYRVRIGMNAMDLIEYAGGLDNDVCKLIVGGAMMGNTIPSLNIPITKNFGGFVALGKEGIAPPESACIRCGRCLRACPMQLFPSRIDAFVRHQDYDSAISAGAMNCMECGSCTYVCPAKRELTQSIRIAKAIARTKPKK